MDNADPIKVEKLNLKRERDSGTEESPRGGGNKKIKKFEIESLQDLIDPGLQEERPVAPSARRYDMRTRTRKTAAPVPQLTSDSGDEHSDPERALPPHPTDSDSKSNFGSPPSSSPSFDEDTASKSSKKKQLPAPAAALGVGAAFFEPGCPAIGCFLPVGSKPTKRPERKDRVWHCHWDGCEKVNWTLYRLNRHIKEKHTKNKFFICQGEGQAFASKEDFEAHQVVTGHENSEMKR